MKVLGKQILSKFCADQPKDAVHLIAWYFEIENAKWKNEKEIILRYPQAVKISNTEFRFLLSERRILVEALISVGFGIVIIGHVGYTQPLEQQLF